MLASFFVIFLPIGTLFVPLCVCACYTMLDHNHTVEEADPKSTPTSQAASSPVTGGSLPTSSAAAVASSSAPVSVAADVSLPPSIPPGMVPVYAPVGHMGLIPGQAMGLVPPPPKRKQVKNACTNCQKACKKCDDSRPCPRCVRYNMADTCINSVRKERKKGIKRGPYKRRTRNGEGSGKDDPEAAANAAALQHELHAHSAQAMVAGYPAVSSAYTAYPAHLGQYQFTYHPQSPQGYAKQPLVPVQYYQYPYPPTLPQQQAATPDSTASNKSSEPTSKQQPMTPGASSSGSSSPEIKPEMNKLAQLVTAALDNEASAKAAKTETA
ncbi:hypothetical protein BC940DRAFT_289659 [Gongronella butleri]|nr:hypothetical protein BC940DRAFT_289659 [Gongronella butleri]